MKVYHIHAVHISAKQGSYLKIIIDICIIVIATISIWDNFSNSGLSKHFTREDNSELWSTYILRAWLESVCETMQLLV